MSMYRHVRPIGAALLAALGLLVSCGGGGVGIGGTGSYTAGSISGFGSVVVGDVRFDDSQARIDDVDGERTRREDLRLGMTVEVDAGPIAQGPDGASASASRILVTGEMLGPVESVDRANGRFVVLGQAVQVGATTVFDGATLQTLHPGQAVEVHAQFDPATARYRATRVEARDAAPPAWRLRGMVAQRDAAARTLRIGSAEFSHVGVPSAPADLAVGSFVRMTLARTPDGLGRWQVLAFGTGERRPPDADGARIKGIVTAFAGSGSFRVNGMPVDASGAEFPDGPAALGLRVEARGSVRAGVLVATRVSIEDDERERQRGFQLRGTISAADAAARSFVVRDVTVSWASGVRFDNGGPSDLVPGRAVEVRGHLSGDGTRLEAARIRFD